MFVAVSDVFYWLWLVLAVVDAHNYTYARMNIDRKGFTCLLVVFSWGWCLRLWRSKLHPSVSKAELEVFEALSGLGLTEGMVTQKTIVLKKCVPDFMWINQRKIVFLDGDQVHNGEQVDRDAEIDNLLELRGWQVLRIPYHAPLSSKDKERIIREIQEFLG